MRHSLIPTLALGALAGLAGMGTAAADIVYLVNGGVLEGRVHYENGRVVVEQATGKVYLETSKVDHVEKTKTEMDVYDERLAALKANDAATGEEYAQLARYANEHGMKARGDAMNKKALAIDPENATARVALGYVKFQDRWMTPDDANVARGLVKQDGVWMTPEAKADLLKAEANADAQRERAKAEDAKAEQERLKLERLDRELQLVDAERQRDYYYRFNAPVVILPTGPGTSGVPSTGSPAPKAAPQNMTPPPNNLGGAINPVEVDTPDGTVRLDPSGALIVKKK